MLSGTSGITFLISGPEPTLISWLPDDKTSHCVFISRCPTILQINLWQGCVTRVATVKGLVLVQQIIRRDEAAVNVAFAQVYGCLPVVLDVPDSLSSPCAENAPKYQKTSVAENHMASNKDGMSARFVVKCSGQLVLSQHCIDNHQKHTVMALQHEIPHM